MYPEARYLPAGDCGVVVEFGGEISPGVSSKVRSMQCAVEGSVIRGVLETIPTYRSLLVLYDPREIGFSELVSALKELETRLDALELPSPVVTEIPTAYGGEYGPDLECVAAHTGLAADEVIRTHSSVDYLIYMLGFTVGYPYLGGMPERLATPRLKSPRARVPAGSVGIAGPQTGIYPIESPGGWQVIGRTPLRLYDPSRNPAVLLRAGDYVRFVPISAADFEEIRIAVESGAHVPTIVPYPGPGLGGKPASPTASRAGADHIPASLSAAQPRVDHGAGARDQLHRSADSFEVLDGGFLTTVQDYGRFGYQQFGMPPSGAMDRFSLPVANLLVGNSPDAAGLEVTYVGPRLRALRPVLVAVTGAEFEPTVNGRLVPQWESIELREGDVLEFGVPQAGCRAYIAVAGGIAVPVVMGSRSTYLRGAVGGIEGRRLASGDRIATLIPETGVFAATGSSMPDRLRPRFGREWVVRAVPGPQADHFTRAGIDTLFSAAWTVTGQSDRMGMRLKGPRVEHAGKPDIISDGIPHGAIQVPGEGQPIVMLADRQTTGGYPKIATVIGPDIDLLGQARPGDTVFFRPTTVEQAHEVLRTYSATLSAIAARLRPKVIGRRAFLVSVGGKVYETLVEEIEAD
ncbi:MAG: 5-oxoprolinase subunit PxpB [Firmicutes bacterium]|nr:5-oxoprolinase subunit PxpB [Bacillota bacterium]